jgi:hypothetical protein
MKIRPAGAQLCHVDRGTKGRTAMTKLMEAFCNLPKVPKSIKYSVLVCVRNKMKHNRWTLGSECLNTDRHPLFVLRLKLLFRQEHRTFNNRQNFTNGPQHSSNGIIAESGTLQGRVFH